jgi:hypothetical protein
MSTCRRCRGAGTYWPDPEPWFCPQCKTGGSCPHKPWPHPIACEACGGRGAVSEHGVSSRPPVVWTEADHRDAQNETGRCILRDMAEFRKREWLRQFPPEQRLLMGGKLPRDYPGGTKFLPHDYEVPLVFVDEATGRPKSPRRLDPRLLDADLLGRLRIECPTAVDEPPGEDATT